MSAASSVRVFSTRPFLMTASPEAYLEQVEEIASWSEDAGCEGISAAAVAAAARLGATTIEQPKPAAEQYLIGSYSRVAHAITGYVRAGYRTFLLDVLANAEELRHIGAAADSLAA